MPRPHRLSLEQLIHQCTQARPGDALANSAACQELVRRAVCDNNDRAWDAIVPHLRTFLLRRIYEQRPELRPQEAERLIFHTLVDFLGRLTRRPNLDRNFLTYSALLTALDKSLTNLLDAI